MNAPELGMHFAKRRRAAETSAVTTEGTKEEDRSAASLVLITLPLNPPSL